MRNYLADMLYALTSPYSRRDYDNQQQGLPMQTNIGKLFSIFAWGMDIVQESSELVKLWDDLEQAKGRVLDRYGANWGVQRFSESDALYRLAIRVKILSQLSGGDTDTVIRAAAELLGIEYTDIEFEDQFPAKIGIYCDWDKLTPERQSLIEPIAKSIKRLVAAGVGFKLYTRTEKELPILNRIGIISGLGFSTTETCLPSLEPERYHILSRITIASGFHTLSVEPKTPNYEPGYDFQSKLGIASDHRSVTRDHLPRQEPSFDYRGQVGIGSVFRTESVDSLPRAEPPMNFRFRFKLAGDFRSVAHSDIPQIETELRFDPPAPTPEPDAVFRFGGRMRIASDFQSTSEDTLPKLEADHEFASSVGIASDLQSSSDSEVPHLEPEQKFKGKAKLVSDAGSIMDTHV